MPATSGSDRPKKQKGINESGKSSASQKKNEDAWWHHARALWATFGPVLLLTCLVASMPVVDAYRCEAWRDTWKLAGTAVALWAVQCLLVIAHGMWPKSWGWLGFLWTLSASNELRMYHAANSAICGSLFFVLVCQNSNTGGRSSGSSSSSLPLDSKYYEVFSAFVQQSYALGLLAVFRIMGSVLMEPLLSVSRSQNSVPKSYALVHGEHSKNNTSMASAPELDWALSASSVIVCILVYSNLGTDSAAFNLGKTSERMVHLSAGQQWMQWALFLLLLSTYMTSGPPLAAQKARWQNSLITATLKLINLVIGCAFFDGLLGRPLIPALVAQSYDTLLNTTSVSSGGDGTIMQNMTFKASCGATGLGNVSTLFTLSLGGADDGDGVGNATSFGGGGGVNPPLAFGVLQSWAQMRWIGDHQSTLVMVLRILLQLWAALHAGRWFVELMLSIMDRLNGLALDVDVHHAADTDDIFFGAATALILAGTYSASNLAQTHGAHTSDDGSESFALLGMLGGLAISLGGSAALHFLVTVLKSLAASGELSQLNAHVSVPAAAKGVGKMHSNV
jgi:hypothetical protein